MKKYIIAAAALCIFTACTNTPEPTPAESTAVPSESAVTTSVTGAPMQPFPSTEEDDTPIDIYTGKEVENPEDLAIHKFNCEVPEGYQVVADTDEGKLYRSGRASITIKAQNYKEEFIALPEFADQACASLKVGNMLNQADTVFSAPENTTVAGFDAVKYDYDVTAYIYLYETNADGSQKLGDDGNPIITDQKEIYGKFHDRIYFFYSDEDVFIITMESPESEKDNVAGEFDHFLETITITPPKG
ncbi:MAG: hypothetical protein J6X85_08325 [Ruminococcus sp.]|nr:hypothetical protein [Ruminococcus sp.]